MTTSDNAPLRASERTEPGRPGPGSTEPRPAEQGLPEQRSAGQEASGRGFPVRPSTAQPRIWRNDYSLLEPAVLGEWVPELSVSVVVPAHGHAEKLALVLASLAAQSYPAHLMEVVVVDEDEDEDDKDEDDP